MFVKSCTALIVFLAIQGGVSLSVQSQSNPIQTAVPFLTLTPDGRSGALGDVGAASSPDVHAQNWNSAKYVFIENNWGIAVSYTPHLPPLINNSKHFYLSGYKRLNNNQVIGGSFRFFTLGKAVFPVTGNEIIPYDFAIDIGYSRLLSDHLSGGVILRYIHSDLTRNANTGGADIKIGRAIAGDLSFYYQSGEINLLGIKIYQGFGMNISNIGNKISYTTLSDKACLPTNLRIGGALTLEINDNNAIALMADLNKLLVPTPPIYAVDSLGQIIMDKNGEKVIEYGMDPNVSLPISMIHSFYDAPGVLMNDGTRSVWREELNEITVGFGLEYRYRGKIALRGGYFHENESKGNRKYFTIGTGFTIHVFALDVSYLIPTTPNSPYKGTFIITLGFEFGEKNKCFR
jgi:hypothetical protein